MTKRHFKLISEEDLLKKINDQLTSKCSYDNSDYYDHNKICNLFAKDLKIDFDFENWEFNKHGSFAEYKDFIGINTFKENNFTFWGSFAGGDWEVPVYFIIYFDGSKLRLYIPKEGNYYNTKTKKAYGNNDEADVLNYNKLYKANIKEADEIDGEFDFELIKKDIISRITLKE